MSGSGNNRRVPKLGLQGLQGLGRTGSSADKPPLSDRLSTRIGTPRQTPRELTGLTPRELGVSERSFKLGELSDSDDESDEALSASPSPAASPAPARAGSRTFNPPPTVAEDEAEEEWEVVPQSADVETDANANDMVPPPMSTDAAVDAPPISPFAVAQPAAGVEAEPGQVPPEGGEAARAFSNALAEEHPSLASSMGSGAPLPLSGSAGLPYASAAATGPQLRAVPARPALNLRPAPIIEGETPDPSPAKGPHDGGRGTYPSPTPNIIDSLMGEVVFETFTPRGPRDDDVRRVRPMADLGNAPAKLSVPDAPNGAAAAPSPIREEPAAEAEAGAADTVDPVALEEVRSAPMPPIPPTAGKRSGDVPPEDADGAVAAAVVAARLPQDMLLGEQGSNGAIPAGESAAGGQPIESLAAGADQADEKLHQLAHTPDDELHTGPAASGQAAIGMGTAIGAAALAAGFAATSATAGISGLKQDSSAAVSSPLRGASPLASPAPKPPLPQDVALPDVSVPDASPEKEREPLLAAANDAVAAPAEALSPSASSPGKAKESALFTSAAPAVASPTEWPPAATALAGDEEVPLTDARSEPHGTPGPPIRGASGTLLNESDQRDLAEGIPLASSPAGRSTPLAERLLLARRSDLAPGLPITPAPSGQVGTVSGDLDLAPGAPITPAPSQALSSRTPSRAGSMPPAPPPTPAEGMSGDASTPVSAARAIPRRFVPPTPPPTPADSLGTAGLLRPPLLAGSMPYRTGSGSPSPGQSPLSSRQASLTMGTGPYVPSGLAPTTSLTSATLAAAAEQETASDATSPFRPQAAADLTRKSPLATSGGGQYATSDAGSETSTSSSVTPHGIGLKSADAVAVGDLVPIMRKSGSSACGSSPIRAVPEEDEDPAEDDDDLPDVGVAPSAADNAPEAAGSGLLGSHASVVQSDAASNVSVAGSVTARRLASLAESPLEQYESTGSDVFEDARSDITGLTAAASLRTEQELSLAPSAVLATDAAGEGLTAEPPRVTGVQTLPAAAALGGVATAREVPASAVEGIPAIGGDAVPMTPRTRARMDPMGDIVRMIETGSARKGARPPNLPSGTHSAAPDSDGAVAAAGTNLGAAFDMEAAPGPPTTAQQQQVGAQGGALEAITEPAGAEFLPPAAVGAAVDVVEPLSGAAPDSEAAAVPAPFAEVQQPQAGVQAAALEAITEPAGAEFLPPAVAGLSEGVVEPLQGSQPAESLGTDEEAAVTQQAAPVSAPEPAPAAAAVLETVLAGGAVMSEAAPMQPESAEPPPTSVAPAAVGLPLMARLGSAPSLPPPAPSLPGGPDALAASGTSAAPSGMPPPSVAPTAAPTVGGSGTQGMEAASAPPAVGAAAGDTDELAAAGLPPGPAPIVTPLPKSVTFAESTPVFSPTDSQPESLAEGANAADAELLTLQRAKTKEGDAAGTATEMPLGSSPASPAGVNTGGSPADGGVLPSKTAKARAALQGTGLTDDALPGAVTVGGVAAVIGAAAAAVGGTSASTKAAPEPGAELPATAGPAKAGGPVALMEDTLKGVGVTDAALPGDVKVATVAAAAAVAAEIPAAAAAKGLVPEQLDPVDGTTGQPVVVTSTGIGAAGGAPASLPLSPPSSVGSPPPSRVAAKGKLASKGPETTNPGMSRTEVVQALGATLLPATTAEPSSLSAGADMADAALIALQTGTPPGGSSPVASSGRVATIAEGSDEGSTHRSPAFGGSSDEGSTHRSPAFGAAEGAAFGRAPASVPAAEEADSAAAEAAETQVQQAVRGYSPEVAVQSVGAGSGADGMVSTAPDGGSGMGATTQAVPPPDPAAAAEATIEPMADAASVVSAVQDQSTMVEPAAAVPEAVDSPAAAVAAAPALAPAAEVSHAAPVPAIGPSAVTLPPVCLSTDETMAPTSPVLVSPFAAIAAVPARFSLDESNSLRTLDTPQASKQDDFELPPPNSVTQKDSEIEPIPPPIEATMTAPEKTPATVCSNGAAVDATPPKPAAVKPAAAQQVAITAQQDKVKAKGCFCFA